MQTEDRWNWVDDITTVKVVNMNTLGLSLYNFRQHVASDISVHGQFENTDDMLTQIYISTLDAWSEAHKVRLNESRTNIIL